MGQGSSCLQWTLTVGIYMGQEAQLFIVGPWGQGITVWVHGGIVQRWVHGGRGQSWGPTACSGYMKAGGPIHVHGAGGAATYSRYVGWVSS